MQPRPLKRGEIVHFDPEGGGGTGWFGNCLMVVTEAKSFGCQGYVKAPGSSGLAYYRAQFEEIEPTGGFAQWMPADEDDTPDT